MSAAATQFERHVSRPLLRWHGGKYRDAARIIAHFPPHETYTEAYAGAASILMHKTRCYAEVLNDLDGELVNLFRVLQDDDGAARLRRLLCLTPYSRAEFEAAYQPSSDAVERARRTIVKSFMGYSSAAVSARGVTRPPTGFRSNVTRRGGIPAHDWAGYPDCVPAFVERLRGVVVESRPALDVLKATDAATTLHYIDPPYMPSTRDAGADYAHEMTEAEHVTLAETLHTLKGMVILSGYACALYDRELYRGWFRVERRAYASGARPRVEVLWLNDAARDGRAAALAL